MEMWNIDYYEFVSGKIPVQEFIDKLPRKSQAKIYNTLELLTEFGLRLSHPHVKKVINTPLWELRILGENSLRFFLYRQGRKSIPFPARFC